MHDSRFLTLFVEGESLDDRPHGLCWLDYKNDDTYYSFQGIGTFTNGVLHGGPLVMMFKGGVRESYSYIREGKAYGQLRCYD